MIQRRCRRPRPRAHSFCFPPRPNYNRYHLPSCPVASLAATTYHGSLSSYSGTPGYRVDSTGKACKSATPFVLDAAAAGGASWPLGQLSLRGNMTINKIQHYLCDGGTFHKGSAACHTPGYCADWFYPTTGTTSGGYTLDWPTPEACAAKCSTMVPSTTAFHLLGGNKCGCSKTTKAGGCSIVASSNYQAYKITYAVRTTRTRDERSVIQYLQREGTVVTGNVDIKLQVGHRTTGQ